MLFLGVNIEAQRKELKGEIVNDDEIEGIHILNKTALKYTVTDTDGSFTIPVRLNDTLTISGLKFKIKEIRISQSMLSSERISIALEEKITELDEVTLGIILTGNINSDIKNTDVETPINFYDLGIPGYTGKPKTLSERKLIAATSSGGGIPLIGLINAISGKTKALKERVQLDKDMECVQRLEATYKNMIFERENMSETLKNRFFSFILDSEKLRATCRSKDEFRSIEFLQTELKLFKLRHREDDKKN